MRTRTGLLTVSLAIWAATSASAAPTVADYERSLNLRDDWSGLTENIAEPAQWIEGTHRFIYLSCCRFDGHREKGVHRTGGLYGKEKVQPRV